MTTVKSYPVTSIRGLTPAQAKALDQAGARTTQALLNVATNRAAERKLAKDAGVPVSVVREAVNRADLMRISGIGTARADLFENAGVNSVKELALRRPDALAETLAAFAKKHPELNYRLPGPLTIESLVQKAKALKADTPVPAAPVRSFEEAQPAARAALLAHIDQVLFSDHPDGASFRDAVLGWRPSTEWPQVQAAMKAQVDGFLTGADAERYEQPDRFIFAGRLHGLYTEVDVLKDTGRANRVYVEID